MPWFFTSPLSRVPPPQIRTSPPGPAREFLVVHVLKRRAGFLERSRVHVRQVVGNGVDSGLLGIHARRCNHEAPSSHTSAKLVEPIVELVAGPHHVLEHLEGTAGLDELHHGHGGLHVGHLE